MAQFRLRLNMVRADAYDVAHEFSTEVADGSEDTPGDNVPFDLENHSST